MVKQRLILMCMLILISTLSYGQLKIEAEYRLRSELRDGYKALSDDNTDPAFITLQRTRLNFDYKTDKLTAYLSLQDGRVWGDTKWGTDSPGVGIHQAYVKYKMTEKIAIKLGRQEITYDKNRLMGVKNWGNTPLVHDAAILQYNNQDKTKADLVIGYNNDKDKNFESDYTVDMYKYLTVLRLYNKFSDQLNLSFLTIIDGNQATASYRTVYARGTSGLYASLSINNITVDAMAYYQYGKSGTGNNISACFFHLKPTLKISDNTKLSAGIDYMSGDNELDNNNKTNSFSTVFGDGHGYFGYMDYFTNIPSHTKNGGLNDIFLQANQTINNKITLSGAFHNFMLSNNILDASSTPTNPVAAKKHLGIEIDAVLAYKFYTNSTLSVGYSALVAQKTMELLKSGSSKGVQNWLFVAVLFKPELFNSNNYQKGEPQNESNK